MNRLPFCTDTSWIVERKLCPLLLTDCDHLHTLTPSRRHRYLTVNSCDGPVPCTISYNLCTEVRWNTDADDVDDFVLQEGSIVRIHALDAVRLRERGGIFVLNIRTADQVTRR